MQTVMLEMASQGMQCVLSVRTLRLILRPQEQRCRFGDKEASIFDTKCKIISCNDLE
jgi:hypothetical protein